MLSNNEELRLESWLKQMKGLPSTSTCYFMDFNSFRWLINKLRTTNTELKNISMRYEALKIEMEEMSDAQ